MISQGGRTVCQGSVAEMLDKPGDQIYDVITHFAKQGKVFNVHFRNIVGGLGNFHEAFIDDGDVDMTRALQCYRDAGYKYMVMPDHVPSM